MRAPTYNIIEVQGAKGDTFTFLSFKDSSSEQHSMTERKLYGSSGFTAPEQGAKVIASRSKEELRDQEEEPMCMRFKLAREKLTLASTLLICVFYWVVSVPAYAACLFPDGLAGQNIAYRYATAYIDSLLNADNALDRTSNVSNVLKRPARDRSTALADTSEALKDLELAARGFECAASAIRPQEQFPMDRSNEFGQRQSELAQKVARAAGVIYLKLAKETRAIASLFVDSLKESVSEVDFAARMAEISANLDDHMRALFQLTAAVPNVLVDPKPDPSGHLSRLRITANERDDLVRMIDTGFGDRARRSARQDLPAIDAAVTMLRQWLTTSGHTPRR